ncbi:MAG: hypothetical protein IKU14_01005, partial [Rhodocyclaceae bacterium]|nr:hypothetical protein [Rhodocyclaceae bacterium]
MAAVFFCARHHHPSRTPRPRARIICFSRPSIMAAQLLFAMLKHPAQTGTLVPSSRALARA